MSERIYTRCPACGNDTLTVNDDKHLICTWIKCPDPTLINVAWIRFQDVRHEAESYKRELAAVTKERDDLKEWLLSEPTEQALRERYEYEVIPSLRAQVKDLTRRLAESEKAQLPSFEKLCKIWDRIFARLPKLDRNTYLGALDELAEHLGISKGYDWNKDEFVVIERKAVTDLQSRLAAAESALVDEKKRHWETSGKLGMVESALKAAEGDKEKLLKAIQEAAEVFRDYTAIHMSKTPIQWDKARANQAHAYKLDAIAAAMQATDREGK